MQIPNNDFVQTTVEFWGSSIVISKRVALNKIQHIYGQEPNYEQYWNTGSEHEADGANIIDVRVLPMDLVYRSGICIEVLKYRAGLCLFGEPLHLAAIPTLICRFDEKINATEQKDFNDGVNCCEHQAGNDGAANV